VTEEGSPGGDPTDRHFSNHFQLGISWQVPNFVSNSSGLRFGRVSFICAIESLLSWKAGGLPLLAGKVEDCPWQPVKEERFTLRVENCFLAEFFHLKKAEKSFWKPLDLGLKENSFS